MAITVDYGPCDQCGEKNSKSAQTCRTCRAPLPWSQAAKTKSASNKSPQGSTFSAPKLSAGISQGFIVQALGGLIFLGGIGNFVGVVSGAIPRVPFLTYGLLAIGGAIWRAGSSMDD